MINWHQRHREQARKERRAILLEGATIDQAIAAARQKQSPTGSLWLWALGIVGPENSDVQPDKRTGTE
jgi:hypothetical protein